MNLLMGLLCVGASEQGVLQALFGSDGADVD
jgi:hypothetical protein